MDDNPFDQLIKADEESLQKTAETERAKAFYDTIRQAEDAFGMRIASCGCCGGAWIESLAGAVYMSAGRDEEEEELLDHDGTPQQGDVQA